MAKLLGMATRANLSRVTNAPALPSRRECERQGRTDGREEIPGPGWAVGSPFLVHLSSVAAARLDAIGERLRGDQGDLAAGLAEAELAEQLARERLVAAQSELMRSEARVNEERDRYEGVGDRTPSSVGSSLSTMGRGWAVAIFIALGAAIFGLALPAVEVLTGQPARIWYAVPVQVVAAEGEAAVGDAAAAEGDAAAGEVAADAAAGEAAATPDVTVEPVTDSGGIALYTLFNSITGETVNIYMDYLALLPILLTLAVTIFLIAYAYSLGVTLKRHVDRVAVQPRWVRDFSIIIGVVVALGLAGIAWVRAMIVPLTVLPADAGVTPESLRTFVLFPTLFLILVGVVLVTAFVAFARHSEVYARIKRFEKERGQLRVRAAQAEADLARKSALKARMQQEPHVRLEQARMRANQERQFYAAAASMYVVANLRNRRRRNDGMTLNIDVPPLQLPPWLAKWESPEVTYTVTTLETRVGASAETRIGTSNELTK
jgi:hypothetical protein